MRKPSVLVIFLTVFIDLVGFGIVVPQVPIYSKHLVPACIHPLWAQGLTIGLIIASYSAMQFIFSPIWGRLSDRHGRRPILLTSTAGASISYVLFALSGVLTNSAAALVLMLVARSFAGMFGGNITVAQAYIADISAPEERSKRMGLIGMAFGLGFIFGPPIGGLSLTHLGGAGPGAIAAGLCAANFLLALFILTESRKPGSAPAKPRPHFAQWKHTLTQPKVGLLVLVFFLATFCFSCFESTLPLVVCSNFHLNILSDLSSVSTPSYLFAYCGFIGAMVQGGTVGRLVKKLGEPKLIALSLVLTALAMVMFPFIKGATDFSWSTLFRPEGRSWLVMLGALALLAVGTNLTRPPLFGLLSNLTAENEQGATIGVAQGAGSLARIIGPIFATGILPFSQAVPYVTCAAILLGTSVLLTQRVSAEPASVLTTAEPRPVAK
jgi:DHA1 family tetracycline resistance protein-like MFS transporter